jgi:hypothetical protein
VCSCKIKLVATSADGKIAAFPFTGSETNVSKEVSFIARS